MEIIAQHGSTLIMLAVVFGLFMAWGIGANDVANALGTSVGSGAITIKTAIIVAAIFEFAGAALAGGSVTRTIRKGIIDPSSIVDRPEILVYGMLAALLAAGCWLAVAAAKGWHPTLWVGPAPISEERQPMSPRPGVTYDFRNERLAALNVAYAELAAELVLPYLDLFTPLSAEPGWEVDLAAGDGVHPTAEGYEVMAELVEEWAGWRGLFK